jgi:hypothetical protein
MSSPATFLHAFAQGLATLALYPEGHASRERTLDQLFAKLDELLHDNPRPVFSFLGEDVIYNDLPLREMRGWEWSRKLAELGVQRLQLDDTVTRDQIEEFLDLVLARLTLKAVDTSEARQMRPSGIRYGLVGVEGQDAAKETPTATIRFTLEDEIEAVRWIHEEVGGHSVLPLAEAEAVVRGLSVAMHGDRQLILPLLRLREFDEYTTTHSINVSVLTMALAEWLGLGARDVRTFGVRGCCTTWGR